MPRFYNPEDSDFTLWIAKKFGNLFQDNISCLSEDDIIKYLKHFKTNQLIDIDSKLSIVIKYIYIFYDQCI